MRSDALHSKILRRGMELSDLLCNATQEYKHVQVPQNLLSNPRGPASAQHVDILGNEEML